MRAGGWKPFWAALGATLLLLLPLVGGTVLLSHRQLMQSRVQAAESQSGVAVLLPKEADRLTLLVCTASEHPNFMLLYLNASQNCLNLLALPSELEVSFGGGSATLAECYAAAGPARCREALEEAFALPEDTQYLALTPELLYELCAPYGTLRVSLGSALSSAELEAASLPSSTLELTPAEAGEQLTLLAPQSRPAARAAVWDAFLRQNLEQMPASLPAALRSNSSALLTSLAAQDYYTLEETLEFLANNSALVQSAALPVEWDYSSGRCSASEASLAAVQALFNVSPTAAQASSGSAP